MYTNSLSVRFGELSVSINSYHVTIRDAKTKEIKFERATGSQNWYDEAHQTVTKAIDALENALVAVAQ